MDGKQHRKPRRQHNLPSKYTVEIADRKSLIKHLKSYKLRKGEVYLSPSYLLTLIEANPNLLEIGIERSYKTFDIDYGVKY